MKRHVLNASYDRAFYEKRPLLYVDFLRDTFVSPMGQSGVECGAGWRPILERLSDELEALISALPKRRQTMFCSQAKQKLGSLRFYMSNAYTDDMQAAISRAEDECDMTCEVCGSSAKDHHCVDRVRVLPGSTEAETKRR